jgi:hypothetical protein
VTRPGGKIVSYAKPVVTSNGNAAVPTNAPSAALVSIGLVWEPDPTTVTVAPGPTVPPVLKSSSVFWTVSKSVRKFTP